MTYEEIKKKYAEPARAHATKIRLAKDKVERWKHLVSEAEKDRQNAMDELNRRICAENKIAVEEASRYSVKMREGLAQARKELAEVETGATINEAVKGW